MSDQRGTNVNGDGSHPCFRIGDHLVRPHMNCISSCGSDAHVEPKVMDLLVYLAKRTGEVCSREELLENVWDYSAVGEEALTTAVKKLRKALKDDSREARYIQTIPRRGYRMVSDVDWDHGSRARFSGDRGRSRRLDWGGRLKPISMVAASVVLIPLVWSVAVNPALGPPENESPPAPYRIRPLTSYPGVESEPAISPDGSRVAFVWRDAGDNVSEIFIKHADTDTPLQLTHDSAMNESPTWSPDGSEVAYVHDAGIWNQIMVIPSEGGRSRRLVRASGNMGGIDWAPDGETIACAVSPHPGLSSRITAYGVTTGLGTELTSPELSGDDDLDPRYSPDGRLIAFVRRHGGIRDDICVVPSDGSEPGRITSSLTRVRGHDWSRDGRSIVCVGVLGGIDATWRVDIATSRITWVPGIEHGARDISVARSSRHMVYSDYRDDNNIRSVRWTESAPPAFSSVANSSYMDDHPAVSPDGKRVAYISERSGSAQLWMTDLDGDTPLQLTEFDGCFVAFPRWSPDADRIVFAANPSGALTVFVVEIGEGLSTHRVVRGANARPAGWSKDGESVYVAIEEKGSWAIWRIGVDDHDWARAVRIASDGAFFGQESLDGRYFYFSKRRQPGLWRVPLDGAEGVGETERVFESFPEFTPWGSWSLCEEGVIAVDRIGGETSLVCRAFDNNVIRTVSGLGRKVTGFISSSRDGSTVVYSLCESERGDLILVESSGPATVRTTTFD